MTGSTLVLTPIENPCLEPLVEVLTAKIATTFNRRKALRPDDALRFATTLLALLNLVIACALMRIPAVDGVPLRLGNSDYVRTPISITALRFILMALEVLGFIRVEKGHYNRESGRGRVTRIHPRPALKELAESYGLTAAKLLQPPAEVTLLHDSETTDPMPTCLGEGEHIIRRWNSMIGDARVRLAASDVEQVERIFRQRAEEGDEVPILRGYDEAKLHLVRIFKGSWDRGGRVYGGSFQNLPKAFRSRLTINGEEVVELDFRGLHPAILYAEAGKRLDFDPYLVPGSGQGREAGKVQFLRLINSKGIQKTKSPLKFDKETGRFFSTKADFDAYMHGMIALHERIAHNFKRDQGMRLQKADSDLALAIMAECMERNIIVLPVHDSFIVQARHRDTLHSVMLEQFRSRYGMDINIHCNDCIMFADN